MNENFNKDLDEDLTRVQSIMDGLDAARCGYTIPVAEMFNPLRQIASYTNSPSLAFAEPATLDLANVIARVLDANSIMAEDVFLTICDMLQKVQENPAFGVAGKYSGTWELAFYGFPITLVYTVGEDDNVTVVAVFYNNEAST